MVLQKRLKPKKRHRIISILVRRYAEPLIVKAIVILVKEQLNVLRLHHSLPLLTNTQVLNAVKGKIAGLAEVKGMSLKWLDEVS